MKQKRYEIEYCSGATGYGWTHETNSLAEAEHTARKMSESFTAAVNVWDRATNDFVYYKNVLEHKPSIDRF